LFSAEQLVKAVVGAVGGISWDERFPHHGCAAGSRNMASGLVPMSTSSIESIAGWSVIAGQRFHWSAGEAGGIDAAAGVRDNPRRQCLHRSIAA
jgi:hypothetical protein